MFGITDKGPGSYFAAKTLKTKHPRAFQAKSAWKGAPNGESKGPGAIYQRMLPELQNPRASQAENA